MGRLTGQTILNKGQYVATYADFLLGSSHTPLPRGEGKITLQAAYTCRRPVNVFGEDDKIL